jgi:outer membrane protein OmpA-like peptidoglycan-associated protein
MLRRIAEIVFVSVIFLGPLVCRAQDRKEPVQGVREVTATRESLAITYPEGATIGVKFRGTQRLPKASGEAKVERKRGTTEVEIELDEMKPASFFGGDLNTYVLWTVSPEGIAKNAGEFILRGNRSKLNVSTPLTNFGMFVTAEPHYLVSTPSRFIVLENTRPAGNITGGLLGVSQIRYKGFDGAYRFDRETLTAIDETKGETRSDLAQAETAIDLAQRAGASQFAADELARARQALDQAQAATAHAADKRQVMLLGHDVVRLAVRAQTDAEERASQAALDAERREHTEETNRLNDSIKAAQSDAERARLETEQRELQLRIEKDARDAALKQAEEAAVKAADEERLRREAEERAGQAQLQAQELARARTDAEMEAARAREEADRARQEQERIRAQMHDALSKVAETRETARGLIVNLPDILFDFNKATLRPQGREVLSKIAGILLVAPGYNMKLEGHTDSIGSEEYNQKLSEKRADSVRDYLVGSGVSADLITTQGFGKTQPVASNSAAEGRQRNRRVEIVIENVPQTTSTTR